MEKSLIYCLDAIAEKVRVMKQDKTIEEQLKDILEKMEEDEDTEDNTNDECKQ